jgi:hypothetical protein
MIRDPGLQGERTSLAWNRTALSVLANALLSFRSGADTGAVLVTFLAIALLASSAVMVAYGARRKRQMLRTEGDIAPSHRAIGLATLLAVATSAVGVASLFV